jgi:hypothetical protein
MSPLESLKHLLIESFAEYESWLRTNTWHGKEHDCVNLFVHKFLFSKISPKGPIVEDVQDSYKILRFPERQRLSTGTCDLSLARLRPMRESYYSLMLAHYFLK